MLAETPFMDALRNNSAFTIESGHLNAPSFSSAAIRGRRLARGDAALSGETGRTVAIAGSLSAIVGFPYRDYPYPLARISPISPRERRNRRVRPRFRARLARSWCPLNARHRMAINRGNCSPVAEQEEEASSGFTRDCITGQLAGIAFYNALLRVPTRVALSRGTVLSRLVLPDRPRLT